MKKKRNFTRELKFGLIVIGAGFLLYFGLNFLKGINIFSSVKNYYTVYEDIGGLVASSPVNIKGYKVGQVDEIKYDFTKETPFIVKISVKKDIALPEGTKIELYDDGIMGGKAIQVLLPEGSTYHKYYENGDTIQSTVSMGLIDQLASGLLPKIESISTQADSLIRELRSAIDSESLHRSINSFEQITTDLSATSVQLRKLMSDNIPHILDNVDVITADFAHVSGNLKQIDYAATFSSLDHTVSNLKSITRKINDPDGGTLGSLINDQKLYLNLLHATDNADSLLVDLKRNPKRYVHFSLFGKNK